MAALTKIRGFSSKSWENREFEEDENHTGTVFDVFVGKMTEVCSEANNANRAKVSRLTTGSTGGIKHNFCFCLC